MASEYLKWKYRNVKPDEKRAYTPAEKRRNWWHYHKGHVALALLLVFIAADIALGVLREKQPDIQFAYVASDPLPEDSRAALERELTAAARAQLQDSKLTVGLNCFVFPKSEDEAQYAAASRVKLMADLETGDSYFFILEDAETFHADYDVLATESGCLSEDMFHPDFYAVRWADAPLLSALPLGGYTQTLLGETVTGDTQALLSDFSFARRGFAPGRTPKNQAACDTLWNRLTGGIKQ